MSHWFDDLTRGLAEQPLSRRSLFALAGRLGIAAGGASLLGRLPAVASAAERTGPSSAVGAAPDAATSSCTVDDSYGILQVTVVAPPTEGQTLDLSHTFFAEVATGNVFSTLTVGQAA